LSTVTAADEYGNACQPVNDSTFSYAGFFGANCYGGAARMRTLIEREGARYDHVFLVDSGASLAFSLPFYLYGSPLIADYFGLLGYDAVAWQVADLQSRLDPGAFMLRARDNNSSMQFVCSNIQGFDAPAGTALSRYAIKTFANTGHKVGYISTLAANLASMIRAPNVSATDEAQALREGLAALVNKGVDKVVATVSSNATAELVLTSVPGIDILIVPGQLQSNTNGSGFLASRVGPYPMVYDMDWGQPVLVVSSGTFGRLVGVLNVEFDDHGVITAWMGDSVLMDDSVPADPALHAELLALDQSVQARFQQVVGWTAVNLSFDNQCIHGECGIGDWLSDSYRDFASGALGFRVQLGLANGGAVRGGIKAGPVTLGQLHQTIPFGSNEVFVIRILGLYVLDALENGLSLATDATIELMSGAGRFLFPSGLRFSWNPTEAPGLRVVDAYVEARQGVWQLLLPNESYTLAIDRWLADGGDGFTMIPEYSTERYSTGGNVNAMLFQALSRNVTGLQTGRITTTTAASRRTCLTAHGSICSGNGYCHTGVCHCTVGGASGRLCTISPAQASSSADQAIAIALGAALPLLFVVVVLVAAVVCALLVRAKKRESDSCWEIDTSELDMGPQLGAGGFGQVYQAVWKGTDVAVKVVPVGEGQQQAKAVCQTFKHEVRVMRELRHPNVVLFMAACTKPPRLCIVMELMELGSLYDVRRVSTFARPVSFVFCSLK
jgi:5'-nucleotidase